ncbi:MAG: YebC/PmpR family DNA-binding transcriptional regulator [Clostridia bacterium]|nr:YebC/PmpR family DNA-binding transcriptional regulator [Clostridia bacterium]
MSGHSKWANIKFRKAKVDAERGKLFTKLGREIIVAAKLGGGDPESNFRLKAAIQRAREANMPNENIQRAIAKGTGGMEGSDYEEIIYEGYGPAGVAVMLRLLTDNRNRTAAEIRHLFSRYGGSLGESGCVAWMFSRKGSLTVDLAATSIDKDEVILEAIEAGAEDVQEDDNIVQVITLPEDLQEIREKLEQKGIPVQQAELAMVPQTTIPIADVSTAQQVLRFMDALEDHDDVQAVWANFDIPEKTMHLISDSA